MKSPMTSRYPLMMGLKPTTMRLTLLVKRVTCTHQDGLLHHLLAPLVAHPLSDEAAAGCPVMV
jgi:hypothetical protein